MLSESVEVPGSVDSLCIPDIQFVTRPLESDSTEMFTENQGESLAL
jgi:hypothetical protein